MYYLEGQTNSLENIATAAKAYINNRAINFATIKSGYMQFVRELQPKLNSFQASDELVLVDQIDIVKKLARFYLVDSVLNDKAQALHVNFELLIDNDEWRRKNTFVSKAITNLQQQNVEIYHLLLLLFSHIFVANSKESGGGSTSAALGVLMIDPKANWNFNDVTEFFVHEITHQLVFLDEYRYRHYLRPVNSVKVLYEKKRVEEERPRAGGKHYRRQNFVSPPVLVNLYLFHIEFEL